MKIRYYCAGGNGCGLPCIIHSTNHDDELKKPIYCPYTCIDKGHWVKQKKVNGEWVTA